MRDEDRQEYRWTGQGCGCEFSNGVLGVPAPDVVGAYSASMPQMPLNLHRANFPLVADTP